MLRNPRAAEFLCSLFVLQSVVSAATRAPEPPDPGGVLRGLSLASFTGSGQNSVQAIAADSSGNIYVAGTTSSPDFPVKNAAQPNFGDARIMHSTDLGATWKPVGSPPADVNAVVVDPVTPQVLFAGGSGGIYKSVDGGATWKLVHAFQPGYMFSSTGLVIDPANHTRVAALAPLTERVIRSVDGGQTWTAGGAPCPLGECTGQLAADPTGSGVLLFVSQFGLYLSRDWGTTFQDVSPPMGAPSTAAFDPSHRGWIYADAGSGVGGTLSLSMDFGATWTQKASPPTTFSLLIYLAVDPDQPNTLVAGAPDGLYKSTDGASSWTRQTATSSFSVETQNPFVLVSHRCSSTGGLFAVGGGSSAGGFQVAFSPDDGATWGPVRLSHISSVTVGANCTAYITRQVTSDAFVAKISVDGVMQWATYLGGSDQDAPVGLALDAQGAVYVTGNTTSPDFPVAAPLIGVPGQSSVFVTKLSTDGKLAYSVLLSGEAAIGATAIAVDARQNAYVIGTTNSQKFPVTAGTLAVQVAPQSYTGFLLKLASDASLVYSTLLGQSYTFGQALLVTSDESTLVAGRGSPPGLPAPPVGGPTPPEFLIKLDPAASQIVSSTYLEIDASALAYDPQGNVLVAGTGFAGTPGAYVSPPPVSPCTVLSFYEGSANVIKLKAGDWTPIYSALISGPCGIATGAMAVDNRGAVALALATGSGLPLHNPLLGGPACGATSSAVARLSPDGSSLEFATYLDNCGVSGLALAPDGSLDVGVSPAQYGVPAGVLNVVTAKTPSISLDQIVNAFSGDGNAVVGGGLYSLAPVGLKAPTLDLGLNANQNLPTELGGVQVRFDGVPAAILHTGLGQVIIAAPANLPATAPRVRPVHFNYAPPHIAFTAVQLISNGVSSNVVWMPIAASRPGLLSLGFPNLAPYSFSANAIADAYNQDGTKNDADHPAAPGSTITLFATGMGATDPPVTPGSIAHSDSIKPMTPVYVSWKRGAPIPAPAPEMVSSLQGFVSALFQIHVRVPDSIQNLGGTTLANGVQRVPVSLYLSLPVSSFPVPASNVVDVFVK